MQGNIKLDNIKNIMVEADYELVHIELAESDISVTGIFTREQLADLFRKIGTVLDALPE